MHHRALARHVPIQFAEVGGPLSSIVVASRAGGRVVVGGGGGGKRMAARWRPVHWAYFYPAWALANLTLQFSQPR